MTKKYQKGAGLSIRTEVLSHLLFHTLGCKCKTVKVFVFLSNDRIYLVNAYFRPAAKEQKPYLILHSIVDEAVMMMCPRRRGSRRGVRLLLRLDHLTENVVLLRRRRNLRCRGRR